MRLAESALRPGLSRRGWMYTNLDFVPPNEEKLFLKLSSDSAFVGVLTYLNFFQPLKKKKVILLVHSISELGAPDIFCLSFLKTLLHSTKQYTREVFMIMLIFFISQYRL